jgi:hypothetical protein
MFDPHEPAGPVAASQIKSKARVRDLAEVYTAEREVRAMLDLVPEFSLTQTFLEPACGNGNFLIEILRRKLQAHPTTRPYFERADDSRLASFPKGGKAEEVVLLAIQAVSTIYGFDICPNNIAETQARLYAYVMYGEDLLLPGFLTGADLHTLTYIEAVTPGHVLPLAADYEESLFRFADQMARLRKTHERATTISPLLRSTLKLVLAKNFQQGDFLAQRDLAGQPLTVGKWTFLASKVRREDFLLSDVGSEKPNPVSVLSLRSLTEFVKGAGNA